MGFALLGAVLMPAGTDAAMGLELLKHGACRASKLADFGGCSWADKKPAKLED
jgi:hypothetical protein